MPPSGFERKAVLHVIGLVQTCYQATLEAFRRGEHPSLEAAFEHEIAQMAKVLERAHITPEGELVER